MIYVGPFIVSTKTVKDTAKGTFYELTAEDDDGNKNKLKFSFENFSDFKAYSIGDPLNKKSITWQGLLDEDDQN